MNKFVHGKMNHFLMGEADGEGNDLGGAEQEESEEEPEEEEESSEDDLVVTIAGIKPSEEEVQEAEAEKAAPKWVKELRQQHREAQKTIRELQSQLKKPEQAAHLPVLGKKPSMEDADIEWDAEKFEQRLTEWHDQKREIDQAQQKQQQAEQQQKTEWEGRLAGYNTAKTTLKVKDFDDAEENVRNLLDVTQQGIIIQGADNSALVVYALGKNPKKMAELAAIKDAVKFAFAIAKLETQLKVQSKKSAPPIADKPVSGTGRIAGGSDTALERLRAEAEKTGDMSKVMAYKREQKRKANG